MGRNLKIIIIHVPYKKPEWQIISLEKDSQHFVSMMTYG